VVKFVHEFCQLELINILSFNILKFLYKGVMKEASLFAKSNYPENNVL